jgi:hypothetical protein
MHMKTKLRIRTAAGIKLCLAAVIIGFVAVTNSMATNYLQLDFTQTGGSYTTGWDPVYANMLAITPTASIANIDSLGYNFSIDNVACYDNGTVTEPLTRSGFYTFGNNANDHNFTLNGLAAGASVSLYGCAAWDGNGRGGVVVFGSSGASGVQAQTIGDPGISPTLANLTLIGTATADGTGTVYGSLNGSGGVGTPTEGQLGGVIFVIAPVPEPGTLALVGLGAAAMLTFRRRQ